MPADEWEVEMAMAEGIRLLTSWAPHKVLSRDGKVTGIEVVQCSTALDDEGRTCLVYGDVKDKIDADQVIMAVGQSTDLSFLEDDGSISVEIGLIVVDQISLATGMEGVFAGGDVVELPGSIIHAIVAGRNAASSIDKALGGTGDIEEVLFEREKPGQYLGRDQDFAQWRRERPPELELGAGCEGFEEVCQAYGDEQAMKEARRCLQCDLRLHMGGNPLPPEKILAFNKENVDRVPVSEGVFQLYDEDHNIVAIRGTANLREDLLQALEENTNVSRFDFEEDKMYSKRESELIQQYLQEHGEMPGGGDSDLDDLF